jgi:hypothetical protein
MSVIRKDTDSFLSSFSSTVVTCRTFPVTCGTLPRTVPRRGSFEAVNGQYLWAIASEKKNYVSLHHNTLSIPS